MFDSVCELFGETIRNMFGCGCYFVVECYESGKCLVWVEVLCWIDRVWSSKECASDTSVHLIVPSIGFVYVLECRKLPPHLSV